MGLIIFSLIMTSLSVGVAAYFFKKNFCWWEYLGLFISPIILSFIIWKVDTSFKETDIEFFTNQTVKVEYIEYWETYVHETCTRRYSCNCSTDSKGVQSCQTCTETYDCSYCDHNKAQYWAYNEAGKKKEISALEYKRIAKKFGIERFVELNRRITQWGGCGQDGDAYIAEWNGDPNKYEIFATKHEYVNKVRLNDSYGFHELSEAERAKIHEYPDINGVYQSSIVGNWFNSDDLNYAKFELDRFNGMYGKSKQIKAFIFTYYNQPISVVDLQRSFFQNGNKNEIIVCVGYDCCKPTWIKCFSWTDEKICENEAVRFYSPDMKLSQLVEHMIPVWTANWKRKEFTPYNQIMEVQPSTTAWVLDFIFTLILIFGLMFGFKENEYNPKS